MANEPAPIVTRTLSDNPVGEDGLKSFINRELIPILLQMRARVNNFMRRPQVPIYDSAPITDTDFDPDGVNPPNDGVLSYSTVDNHLYIRLNGNPTHVQIT